MKTMRRVITSLSVLALLALGATSVRAGESDCTGGVSSCGWYSTSTQITADTKSGPLVGGGHSATFTEYVYQTGSLYTYAFQINNTGAALGSAKISTVGSADNFNCLGTCDSWGFVDGGITTASSVTSGTFAFGQLSMTLLFGSALNNGQSLTFYLQGGTPFAGTFNVGNGSSTTGSANALAAPEPNVLMLLGSLLFMLLLGMPFASRLRAHTA